MAGVACALLCAEHARRAPREAALLPAAEAAGERGDVLVAELLERAGGERRARTRLAGDHDRRREVGDDSADARLEVAARDVHGVLDRALVELVGLAHVYENGRLVGGQAGGSFSGADLVDLRLQLSEKFLVRRHGPANATCIPAIPSRLLCAAWSAASTGSVPCRLRWRARSSSPWPWSAPSRCAVPRPQRRPARRLP